MLRTCRPRQCQAGRRRRGADAHDRQPDLGPLWGTTPCPGPQGRGRRAQTSQRAGRGCPAAKDILEAYLGPVAGVTEVGKVRQYVGDFMFSVDADTSAGAALRMNDEIHAARTVLRGTGVALNDGKEPLLVATSAGRREWAAIAPDHAGKVTGAAKDLGVCQRRRGERNIVAEDRAKSLAEVYRRNGFLALEHKARLRLATALVGGAGLYGAEVDKPNHTSSNTSAWR